jgi:hypothetical protein
MMKQKCDAEGLADGLLFLCVFVADGVAAALESSAVRVGAEGDGEGEAEGEAAPEDPLSGLPATEA